MFTNLFLIIYVFLFFKVLYIWLTRSTKQIIVKQKLLVVEYGFTQYVIVDSHGQIYYLSLSLWFGKLNPIDDWIKIKLNKKYSINYYGINSKLLDTRSQIVDIY